MMEEKLREYIVSYSIVSNKLRRDGLGNTIRQEKDTKFNFNDWHESTIYFWNKEWETDDVSIILTNIFENK